MHAPTARIFGLPAAACRAKNPRNCLARLPPVFPRKSVVSSSTRGRFWAYEAVNPRFPPEKQGLDALNNYSCRNRPQPYASLRHKRGSGAAALSKRRESLLTLAGRDGG